MALTLLVISFKNHTPAKEMSMTVNNSVCRIGRAADSDFVLPDEDRVVSQHHAVIQPDNGAYYLIDESTNGTFINNAAERIAKGNKIRLHDGDVLKVGEYNCAISIIQQQDQAENSLSGGATWQTPLHDPTHEKLLDEKLLYRESSIPNQPPLSSEGSESTSDQDYFRPPEAIREDWYELSGKFKKEPGIDELIPEPIKKIAKRPSQPKSPKKRAVTPTPIVPEKVRVQRKTEKTTHIDQQAVAAFLRGAGLTQIDIEPETIMSFMTTAGQLVREITQGFRQVLDSRTSIKGEFRLGVTTIRPVENNPLKFSVDVNDALTKLLMPPAKGYLPPVTAIQEATDDLQAHQMALLAGLRAALSSLVAHFDPESLEKDFQKVSAIDNLLPFTRKAKYWELFKTRYSQAAADAENDFLHFLGDEFAIAYEQQILKLKNARQNNNL